MLSLLSSWATTISLIFGGCCSNAITLEQLTSAYPKSGSILTFFQFLVISLHGLPKFLIWTRYGPRFRPRRVPIMSYLAQVTLFYIVSLLNNAAFAYNIPMAVHIIFRSGGLMISLALGWLISKKKYSQTQVLSVMLVTVGVVLTTLSAQSTSSKSPSPTHDAYKYIQGIGILTLALVLSGFLGLVQDWTYTKYGRPALTASTQEKEKSTTTSPAPWQESMFYLHFLALPMFLPLLPDLIAQLRILNNIGPRAQFGVPIPIPLSAKWSTPFPLDIVPPFSLPRLPLHIFPQSRDASFLTISQTSPPSDWVSSKFFQNILLLSFSIPQIYFPLILNTVTQLLCVAGVNRLTTSVTSLTVTLVLVVRKAASLVISVIGISQVGLATRDVILHILSLLLRALGVSGSPNGERSFNINLLGVDIESALSLVGTAFVGAGSTKPPQQVDNLMMWTGAALVLLGTVGYTIGSSRPRPNKSKTE